MADLKTALHRIHESAKLVNRAKQLNESRERIAELTSRLKLQYPLATEHRRYLGEGPVLYIGPNADRPLAAYLFLFNDQMLVTKRHYDRKKLKSHTTKFSCVCNIPLGGAAMTNGSLSTGEVAAISPDTPNSRSTSPTKGKSRNKTKKKSN
ncbi:MAG: hypothetical protein BJ554DRAFT_119 [Olpidium bornovanus]|uniref:Uncharacterized protein n=1 Tax=Olpidium bornovanus TaxID=278681 RepID=A0A8H7ZUB3_9FUNG|nr:MAG: hypothetical protein BJ554DRAFT_119 [Olpidium bornovanus]